MSDRYAVIGNPVAHSKSPQIHAAFARLTSQDMTYEAILAPPGGFVATVRAFIAAGGRGMNVTVPFKLEAYALADTRSPRAEAAKAVNTLVFSPAGIHGDNTDGLGLVADLTRNLGFQLAGKRILLLGAGGAARFKLPRGLALGPDGNLYLADSENHRIRKITLPDGVVSTVAGGNAGDGDGSAAAAQFRRPVGLTFGADRRLYVVEELGHRVRVIDGL